MVESTLLDLAVAQNSFRARQIERALHDAGPWEISWGPFTRPACRLIHPDRVVFHAHFPSQCYLIQPEPVMTLLCAGEAVGTREIPFPGDGEFEAIWEYALADRQSLV